jgi:M6 family metalloprotease-like protein
MPTRPTPRRRFLVVLASALLVGLVGFVGPSAAPFVADASAATTSTSPGNCVLPEDGSMGQMDWDTFRRPVGTLRAVMLFVDFPDVPAKEPADTLFATLFGKAPGWLARSSYGTLNLAIQPLRQWVRMPEPLSAFKPVNGALQGDVAKRYIGEAIAAADPEVDFSQFQIVYIVPPREAAAYSRSSEGIYNPDEGWIADGHVMRAIVTLGSSVYTRGYKVLDHETSHAFGLRDYYPTTSNGPLGMYTGTWSVMADAAPGGDHFAWDKWRMGWLADSQVRCVTAASRTSFVLSPLETVGGVKAVVLRTGLQTAVVAEYRTRSGLDTGMCSTGVLIYKVNSALAGGVGPIRAADARPHSAHSGTCGGELDDAAFHVGGRWTNSTSGLEIDVTSVGATAGIRVIRTKTYVPPTRYPRTITATSTANPDGTQTLTATIAATAGFAPCAAGQVVSLQQLRDGEWWTLLTSKTDATGAWSATWTPDATTEGAPYRVLAPERAATTLLCALATTQLSG